jgi:hypothetical protein
MRAQSNMKPTCTRRCCYCHEFVMGLFCVCPGCGHGGHLHHMRLWFAKNSHCPAGCGHQCSLTHISARSSGNRGPSGEEDHPAAAAAELSSSE